MPGVGAILLTAASLAAVALIAWILAAGVESGVRAHGEKQVSRADSPDSDSTP